MAFSSEIEKLERRWTENPLGLTFAPLAEAYRKAGDRVKALELLEQGLTQHPNYVPAHIVRGRCHLDAQADGEAELAFLRVTELDPENVIALKGLAELCERTGRIREAVQRLEQLLDVDRNNEEARGQLDRVKEILASAVPVPTTLVFTDREPVASEAPAPEPIPLYDIPVVAESSPQSEPEPEPEPIAVAPEPSHDEFGDHELGDLQMVEVEDSGSDASSEFQIPNDAEMLRPSDHRLADVLLSAEDADDFGSDSSAGHFPMAGSGSAPDTHELADAPDPLAAAGIDTVDAMLGDDYAPLIRLGDEDPRGAPEPPPEFSQESLDMGLVPVGADVPPPIVDVMPPPPSPPFEHQNYLPPPPEAEVATEAPAMEQVAEAAAEPEHYSGWQEPSAEAEVSEWAPLPDPVSEPEPALVEEEPASASEEEAEPVGASEEPELVVTETMAEIFLRQGHRELAHAVYAQLALRDPDNQRIAEALARLAPEPVAEAPAPVAEAPPAFAAAQTGGRSVEQLFGVVLHAPRPTAASAIHPPAFEQPKRAEPTRPAQEALRLSAVFGEESLPTGPAGVPAPASGTEPSFDEFFSPASGSSADTELPRAPESEPAQVPEDLEQFNAWLRGLKR